MGFHFAVRPLCDKPPPKCNQQSFPQIQTLWLLPRWTPACSFLGWFVKTSQHLGCFSLQCWVILWMEWELKGFVTVNFASLCLKSKWEKLHCQFAQKGAFKRTFVLNTFICNTCTYFVFSVTCGLFNYTTGIWTVAESDTEKAWPRKTEVLLILSRFFNLRGDFPEKATWQPSCPGHSSSYKAWWGTYVLQPLCWVQPKP